MTGISGSSKGVITGKLFATFTNLFPTQFGVRRPRRLIGESFPTFRASKSCVTIWLFLSMFFQVLKVGRKVRLQEER